MSVGLLIFFAIAGAVICARVRVAGGAVAFAVVAVVLFVSTPAGAAVPGAISAFLSTFDRAATPVLEQSGADG